MVVLTGIKRLIDPMEIFLASKMKFIWVFLSAVQRGTSRRDMLWVVKM